MVALRRLFCCCLIATAIIVGAGLRAPSTPATTQLQLPQAEPGHLWNYISQDNPYRSWKNVPNQAERFIQVKETPHGDWVAIYLNDPAYESLANPSNPFQMKYGSIVVKENYSPSKASPSQQPPLVSVPVTLVALTVMYKVKGFQTVPGEEEWFWVMYRCNNGQCDGSVATVSNQPWINDPIPVAKGDTFTFYKGAVLAGKPWLCIECHTRAKQQDQFAFGDYLWRLRPFMPK
jgi:hypothetical protein